MAHSWPTRSCWHLQLHSGYYYRECHGHRSERFHHVYGNQFLTGFNIGQDFLGTNFPIVVSVSPDTGSGSSQVFTIVEDTEGSDSVGVNVQFLGADNSACKVEVFPGNEADAPYAMLLLDSGAWSGPLNLPSLENLQNSICTINGALSSVSGPGELVTIELALTFSQAFAGSRYVYADTTTEPEFDTYNFFTYATWIVPADPNTPALTITSTHTGNFTQAQTNTYTLTVSNNPGAAASFGTVTVTDTLPQQMTLASMAGTGWNCTGATCSRNDPLAGGNSYPPITVTVNVGDTFLGGTNQATVSGGASATVTVSDYTFYTPNYPEPSLSSGHVGNFTQGQTNATYTIIVSDQAGSEPFSQSVTVTDNLPYGLTLVGSYPKSVKGFRAS